MKQEHTLLVAIHEVVTVILVIALVKVLVTWNINDLHLYRHEWILVMVRRHTNEAIELFLFTSVLGLFKEDFVEPLSFASKHNWLRLTAGLKQFFLHGNILFGVFVVEELQFHHVVILLGNIVEVSDVRCDHFVLLIDNSCGDKVVENFGIGALKKRY